MANSVTKKPKGRFTSIPHVVQRNEDYRNLSGNAVKLLLALAYQYNGRNNGDMTAAWSVMNPDHGFRSQATLSRAIKELLAADLITRTRHSLFQHPNNQCSLFALNWQNIDECPGKRLERKPTRTPIRKFSKGTPKARTLKELASPESEKTGSPVQNLNTVRSRNGIGEIISDAETEASDQRSAPETVSESNLTVCRN